MMNFVAFDSNGFLRHPRLVVDFQPLREVGEVEVEVGEGRIATRFDPHRSDSENGQVYAGVVRDIRRVPIFAAELPAKDALRVTSYVVLVTGGEVVHIGRELVPQEQEWYKTMVSTAREALRKWEEK